MKITSVNNELVKETAKLLQKKYRKDTFLLEGSKCIEEAIASGLEIVHLFADESSDEFKGFDNLIETTEVVLSKISSTETPPKAVAVAKKPKREWTENYKKVVLLENIKDAGNLGTILRTASAFNIDAVVLYGDTVDLYNPKCVRSAVGNLWKIPVFEINDFEEIKCRFSAFERIATLPKSHNTVWLKDYVAAERNLIMFGSEAKGLSSELKDFATKNITIEMSEKVESLNLSISVGIILYKLSQITL